MTIKSVEFNEMEYEMPRTGNKTKKSNKQQSRCYTIDFTFDQVKNRFLYTLIVYSKDGR